MTPVKASSFGRRIGCARRYPGGGTAASCAPSHGPARSGAPPRARSIPPHIRCAAPPHRAPLDTSLLCSTKHPGNARWTTHAVWFSAALRPRHPAALWSSVAPPFSDPPREQMGVDLRRVMSRRWRRPSPCLLPSVATSTQPSSIDRIRVCFWHRLTPGAARSLRLGDRRR